jgi:hypothetical protein
MPSKSFRVRVVGPQVWDPARDNVDVEVTLADGSRFGATFFTVTSVQRLFRKNRATGECGGGRYLWAANMILVQELTTDVIKHSVRDLLDRGKFGSAFCRLTEP